MLLRNAQQHFLCITGIVTDEPNSDLQVSHREVWEKESNSEIVA